MRRVGRVACGVARWQKKNRSVARERQILKDGFFGFPLRFYSPFFKLCTSTVAVVLDLSIVPGNKFLVLGTPSRF